MQSLSSKLLEKAVEQAEELDFEPGMSPVFA